MDARPTRKVVTVFSAVVTTFGASAAAKDLTDNERQTHALHRRAVEDVIWGMPDLKEV
jgi:hypothetical protein